MVEFYVIIGFAICKIDTELNSVVVVAGKINTYGFINGLFEESLFYRPKNLVFDSNSNTLYVIDNYFIRKICLITKTVSSYNSNLVSLFNVNNDQLTQLPSRSMIHKLNNHNCVINTNINLDTVQSVFGRFKGNLWPIFSSREYTKSTIWVDESGDGKKTPLVICAVYIIDNLELRLLQNIITIHDCKLLSPTQNRLSFKKLSKTKTLIYFVKTLTSEFVQKMGYKKAWNYGVLETVTSVINEVECFDNTINLRRVCIDGDVTVPNIPLEIVPIVHGDQIHIGISCASILAYSTKRLEMKNIERVKYEKRQQNKSIKHITPLSNTLDMYF
jgi:ribonuclease HII